jgi:hypothetical protein
VRATFTAHGFPAQPNVVSLKNPYGFLSLTRSVSAIFQAFKETPLYP